MNTYLHKILYMYYLFTLFCDKCVEKYEKLKAWTFDNQVVYKASHSLYFGDIDFTRHNECVIVYNYDTFFYTLIFSITKLVGLSMTMYLEDPSDVIITSNTCLITYYQGGKLHGEILTTSESRNRESQHFPDILYVLVHNINFTNEFLLFKESLQKTSLLCAELIDMLWIYKYRKSTSVVLPYCENMTVIYDNTFKKHIFKSNDIIEYKDE